MHRLPRRRENPRPPHEFDVPRGTSPTRTLCRSAHRAGHRGVGRRDLLDNRERPGIAVDDPDGRKTQGLHASSGPPTDISARRLAHHEHAAGATNPAAISAVTAGSANDRAVTASNRSRNSGSVSSKLGSHLRHLNPLDPLQEGPARSSAPQSAGDCSRRGARPHRARQWRAPAPVHPHRSPDRRIASGAAQELAQPPPRSRRHARGVGQLRPGRGILAPERSSRMSVRVDSTALTRAESPPAASALRPRTPSRHHRGPSPRHERPCDPQPTSGRGPGRRPPLSLRRRSFG